MKTPLNELLSDAELMLDTIRKVKSDAYRKGAASSLVTLAAQIQNALSEPETPAEPQIIDITKQWMTSDGRPVTNMSINSQFATYPVLGTVDGVERTWTMHGVYRIFSGESPFDLIPYQEKP